MVLTPTPSFFCSYIKLSLFSNPSSLQNQRELQQGKLLSELTQLQSGHASQAEHNSAHFLGAKQSTEL